jgi:hypothetical protein
MFHAGLATDADVPVAYPAPATATFFVAATVMVDTDSRLAVVPVVVMATFWVPPVMPSRK